MGVTYGTTEMASMTHDGVEVQTWIHDGIEVYTAGKMVTYVVDTSTSYQEKVKKGASCLSPTTFTPTKSGWTFLGWRTDKTASSDVLTSKVMEKSAITLYAVFKATVTCYTYNGSSNRSSSTGTRYYNNGNYNNPTFKLTQNGISGWSSNGWCTSNGATAGIAVANGGSVTLSGDATYYGRYSQTIYLYYNGNGNTGGSTGTQSGTRYFNSGNYSNPTFTIAWNGFSRTYYNFSQWALNGTGGTRYNANSTITLSSSATMYAIWTGTSASASITAQASMVGRDGLRIFPNVSGSYQNSVMIKCERGSLNNTCISWYGDYCQVRANTNCNVVFSFGYFAVSSPDDTGRRIIKIYRDDTEVQTIRNDSQGGFQTNDIPWASNTIYLSAGQRCSVRVAGGKADDNDYARSIFYASGSVSATAV